MSELTGAIRQGDAAKVAALIDENRALLEETENGVTPVLLALYHGKAEIARLLAERGTPLSFAEACALGELEQVQSMLAAEPALLDSRTTDGFPAWALAVFFRQPLVARYLIEQGVDVNAAASNAMRVSAVHAAAAACDHETMKMLLERGADANARQQMDYTPMHGAASRGDMEMAKLLLSHGADRNAKAADGKSPADVARDHEHHSFAGWLESD